MAKVAIVDGNGDGATGGCVTGPGMFMRIRVTTLRRKSCHDANFVVTGGATSDDKVGITATLVFQWIRWPRQYLTWAPINTMIMPIHIICHRHFGAGLLSKLSRDKKDAQIRYFLVWKQKFCAKFSFQGPGLINYLSIYSAFAQDRIGNFEKWHPNTQGWSNVHFID